ncbi:MAG: hypothetical protein EOP11_07490 [Proteobacteria bacterium]|nr:MAG: hypothetical protein EOP11_07490 [Pseudomonadota bacterium]
MKFFALWFLSLVLAPAISMAASPDAPAVKQTIHFTEGAQELSAEIQDGELVRVVYPYVEKAEPRVEVREESLIYQGACEVMEVKNEAPRVEMIFKLPSTFADSGFNGCRVAIDRGFASDESDLLHLDYGYTIWD